MKHQERFLHYFQHLNPVWEVTFSSVAETDDAESTLAPGWSNGLRLGEHDESTLSAGWSIGRHWGDEESILAAVWSIGRLRHGDTESMLAPDWSKGRRLDDHDESVTPMPNSWEKYSELRTCTVWVFYISAVLFLWKFFSDLCTCDSCVLLRASVWKSKACIAMEENGFLIISLQHNFQNENGLLLYCRSTWLTKH